MAYVSRTKNYESNVDSNVGPISVGHWLCTITFTFVEMMKSLILGLWQFLSITVTHIQKMCQAGEYSVTINDGFLKDGARICQKTYHQVNIGCDADSTSSGGGVGLGERQLPIHSSTNR